MAFWRTAGVVAAILACSALTDRALAWSPAAHRAIARVAQENLSNTAKLRVRLMLGRTAKLEDSAGWADTIIAERPETEAWHSITFPTGAQGLDLRRDCPVGDCVTAKIRDFVGVIRLAYREKARLIEGLRFLVDLTADLHQPLNVGKPPSESEDEMEISLDGESMTLYDAWDTGFLADADEEELADAIRTQLTPDNRKRWSRGHIKTWTWETHQTALKQAYTELPGGDSNALSPEYVERARAVSEEQLAKAAVRLAALFNEIWP